MIPELEDRTEEFEFARHRLIELVSGLDDARFAERPTPKRWSMAECVDHLLVTGWKMIPRLDTAIIDGRRHGWYSDGPFKYSSLGNWFVRAIGGDELPPSRMFKVPRLYVPGARRDWKIPQAVQEFTNLQEKYKTVVHSADGLDLVRIKITSPAAWFLRLSLGQWLRALASHQKRHLWQAGRVREGFEGRG